MFSKIYFATLGLAFVAMSFFALYSWSWLQSIGFPTAAAAGYEYHAGIGQFVLWGSVAVLLLLANAVLWTSGRALAIWATFVYFTFFVVVRSFWLDQLFFHFKKANGLSDGSFSIGPFLAVLLIALVAMIAFFDQFIVLRLRSKTFGEQDGPERADDPESEA
ncbi:MAG: hypothetical protein AB7J13_13335 [Pyrinomonadaceae bacterium]